MLTSAHPFQIGLFSSTVATFIAISYPSLQQDPNVVTQSLLAQIVAQQLSSANSNGLIPPTTPTTQTPFSPSTSVVFVNSVWFLSLVLSLTCALMATLLQQWARRYLQMVRQNHPPEIRAHIREYFYQGARRFGIFGLVELLPSLIVIAVLLFFAGLVVFAFLANHTVAHITLSIVGFCFLLYIVFTLMPLIFHDCPYCTPLTSVLWFASRKMGLAFYWVRDRGATYLHRHWDLLSERRVELCRQIHEKKAKLWSENMVSQLQVSAKSISIEIYKESLAWTLSQISKDHELEEFVAGIPDLYESNDIITAADILPDIQPRHLEERVMQRRSATQRNIRRVLADLPAPTNSDGSFSWTILWLASNANYRNLSTDNQYKRIQTSLTALYHIPGAIRDLLSPYAAADDLCCYTLGLLNSPESLEIIDELWNLINDDVKLSVRCAAALVAAFMITPPRRALHMVANLNTVFIGNDNTGKRFLAKRLRVDPTADGRVAPELHPNSDAARLQNIVRFFADIKALLWYMNREWWSSDDADSICRERDALFESRHTEEYCKGFGIYDQKGDRASAAFIPAAQQDLIILTLEVLARGPVADMATSQREAFLREYMRFERYTMMEAQAQAAQAAEFIEMIRRALEPVFRQLDIIPPPIPVLWADPDRTRPGLPSPQLPVEQIATPQSPSAVTPVLPDLASSSGPPPAVGSLSDSYV